MKLFEITQEYQSILSSSFNSETGELDDQALSKINDLQDDMKSKSIALASFIKNLDAEQNAIDEAIASMARRKSSLLNKISKLNDYLKCNMEKCSINEISSPYFDIKLKKCPLSVDIVNEDDIPKDYIKIKEVISLDKVKIKEDIQNGIDIPGALLKQNVRIEIK